jgi:hypothetical protein
MQFKTMSIYCKSPQNQSRSSVISNKKENVQTNLFNPSQVYVGTNGVFVQKQPKYYVRAAVDTCVKHEKLTGNCSKH